MPPGFQKAGAPSYASKLRGEPAPYKPSRADRPGNNVLPTPPSESQNKNYNKASMPNNARNHQPSTPSNLGMYSQAHMRTQNSVVANQRLPSESLSGNGSVNTIQTKRPEKDTWMAKSTKNLQTNDPQDVADSMASLSISQNGIAEPVIKGRRLDRERPTPSASSKMNNHLPKPHQNYTPSAYSISYKRTHDQTPMEQATYREYRPFHKSEFKIGMIIRMNMHESDFNGPSKATIPQPSQASTLVDGGRGFMTNKAGSLSKTIDTVEILYNSPNIDHS